MPFRLGNQSWGTVFVGVRKIPQSPFLAFSNSSFVIGIPHFHPSLTHLSIVF
jgi:hypothetical protein